MGGAPRSSGGSRETVRYQQARQADAAFRVADATQPRNVMLDDGYAVSQYAVIGTNGSVLCGDHVVPRERVSLDGRNTDATVVKVWVHYDNDGRAQRVTWGQP